MAKTMIIIQSGLVNSLTPGRLEWNFIQAVFKWILVIDGCGNPSETAIRWMSLDLSHDKSTLFQVMAWCRQATSHYLSQCWLRSMLPYGVIRLQYVNKLRPGQNGRQHFQMHFLEIKVGILIQISLKFVPKGPLVETMAWCHQARSCYLIQFWTMSMASPGHKELTKWFYIYTRAFYACEPLKRFGHT